MRQFYLLILHLSEQNLIQVAKELKKMIGHHKNVFMDGSIFDSFRKYETKTNFKGLFGHRGLH